MVMAHGPGAVRPGVRYANRQIRLFQAQPAVLINWRTGDLVIAIYLTSATAGTAGSAATAESSGAMVCGSVKNACNSNRPAPQTRQQSAKLNTGQSTM